MRLSLITFLLFLSFCVYAQKGKVTGTIIDAESKQAISYATISAFKSADSSLVTGTITGEDGNFELELPFGNYYVWVEFISYQTKSFSNISLTGSNSVVNLGTIALESSSYAVDEVEVIAEKSQVQIGLDKKTFNVGQDITSAGGNAADILENIPSVSTDMEGNISLRGSSNVRILIDGKPSGLTGISTAEVLQQLPANMIERIEVITNPSAKYDSEGMAGIINIVLKKDRKKGLNGMISGTVAYPADHSLTFNYNYRKNKINYFGGLGISYDTRPGLVNHYRETYNNDTLVSIINQVGTFERGGFSYNARLGADFFINDKNTLTASGFYQASRLSNSQDRRYYFKNSEGTITDIAIRDTKEMETDYNIDAALSYKRSFKKEKQELTADMQYTQGGEVEDMDIIERQYLPDSINLTPDLSVLPIEQNTINKEMQSNLLLQADYVHPFGEKGRLEAGYKSTFRNIDLNYDIQELETSSEEWVHIDSLSNHFIYNENIFAGYLTYSNQLKKLKYQLGLRTEYTDLESRLVESNDSFPKNYLGFFPTVHLSRNLTKTQVLQLSYSRRLDRPGFWNLTPFVHFADPLNLWVGNPGLDPEYNNNFEAGYIKYWDKGTLSSSIYYRHTTGGIVRIRTVENGISTTRPENLAEGHSYGVELTFSKDLWERLKLNGSFNAFGFEMDGSNINADYTAEGYSWTSRLNSQLSITKTLQLQTMINYRGPSETPQGIRKGFYFVDAGLQKTFMNNRGTVNFRVSDVFNTRLFEMETFGDDYYIRSQYTRWRRTFYLSFSYKINQYKPERRENYEYEGGGEF